MKHVPYQEKAEWIAADLRRRIVAGEYAVGERLPTRVELMARYGVSSKTLQRALDWLMEDGFVVAEGRRGTFVHSRPPHLTNYALLFPNRFPNGVPTNCFHYALFREAQRRRDGRLVRIYDGFCGRSGFLDYDSLLEDVRQQRLAGLIFETAPHALEGTPLLTADGIPRTAIMSIPMDARIPAVYPDVDRFVVRAAERFAAEGRRNVVVLVNATWKKPHVDALRGEFRRRDLFQGDTPVIGASIESSAWTGEITRLLFGGPAATRPDALLLTDDHFIEPATRMLDEMGLRAPDDVLVIGHANFPWIRPSHLPLVRLGFQVPDLLNACIANIDLARQGQTPPPLTLLPPWFEDELVTEGCDARVPLPGGRPGEMPPRRASIRRPEKHAENAIPNH